MTVGDGRVAHPHSPPQVPVLGPLSIGRDCRSPILLTVLLFAAFVLPPSAFVAVAQSPPSSPVADEPSDPADDLNADADANGVADPPTDTEADADAEAGEVKVSPALPEIASLQTQLDSVTADETLEEAFKARLIASLRSSIDQLRTLAELEQAAATSRRAVETAPERLKKARNTLADPPPAPRLPPEATDERSPLSLDVIRQRRTEAAAQLNAAREEQQQLELTQRERAGRVTGLASLIADARTAADEAIASTVGDQENDPAGTLRAARETERLITIALARQRLATLLAEQARLEAEAELLPLQLELAAARTRRAGETLKLWDELLGQQKQYRIETELGEFRRLIDETSEGQSDPVEESRLLSLGPKWIELTSDNAALQRTMSRIRTRFDALDSTFKEVAAEIERDLESSEGLRSGLGLKLLRIRSRLPSPASLRSEIREVDDALERARQLQSETELAWDDLRYFGDDSFRKPPSLRQSRAGNGSARGEPESRNGIELREQLLLRQLMADIDEHINDLIEVKGLFELKRRRTEELRSLIEENVIWIRGATTIRLSRLPAARLTLRRMLEPENLTTAISTIVSTLPRRIDLVAVWGLAAILPWVLGRRLRRHLQRLNRAAVLPNEHPVLLSVSALVITLLLSFPPVVSFAVLGLILTGGGEAAGFSLALGESLVVVAVALLPLRWLRQLLRSNGLFETHFGYEPQQTRPAGLAVHRLSLAGIPAVLFSRLASNPVLAQGEDTLGRLSFALVMLILALVSWRAFHPQSGVMVTYLRDNPDGWLAKLQPLWHAFTLIPLILAGLSLAGYTYAATLLAERLYWSLWFAIALLVFSGLMTRWVLARCARRRSGPTEDGPVSIAAKRELTEIDAQAMRLLNVSLWIVVLVGAAWLWAPVLPAVRILDRVPLWDSTALDGSIVPITLAHLVTALPIVVLTWVAARNLPGLIESVLLERLPLDKPARYAITSLASYGIAIVGILLTSNTLGLRWEGIQWLVAALGVGLGFGLQEIFANFVSGIILLFEQPIRVGDVVTIGDTTGTVSRIRIRATVVRNWHRQELIIPNKNLITERIINWTLSDSVNRLELRIGVAYGTDTRAACRLLEEVCNQHDNILIDPKPIIAFEGFGDSTLNLIAYCFLDSLEHRIRTMHELNTAIDERFKQAGIEIAFPQQDLHIRSIPPEWGINRDSEPRSIQPE